MLCNKRLKIFPFYFYDHNFLHKVTCTVMFQQNTLILKMYRWHFYAFVEAEIPHFGNSLREATHWNPGTDTIENARQNECGWVVVVGRHRIDNIIWIRLIPETSRCDFKLTRPSVIGETHSPRYSIRLLCTHKLIVLKKYLIKPSSYLKSKLHMILLKNPGACVF